eukprot:1414378-Rhodomonas_salina.1
MSVMTKDCVEISRKDSAGSSKTLDLYRTAESWHPSGHVREHLPCIQQPASSLCTASLYMEWDCLVPGPRHITWALQAPSSSAAPGSARLPGPASACPPPDSQLKKCLQHPTRVTVSLNGWASFTWHIVQT